MTLCVWAGPDCAGIEVPVMMEALPLCCAVVAGTNLLAIACSDLTVTLWAMDRDFHFVKQIGTVIPMVGSRF